MLSTILFDPFFLGNFTTAFRRRVVIPMHNNGSLDFIHSVHDQSLSQRSPLYQLSGTKKSPRD